MNVSNLRETIYDDLVFNAYHPPVMRESFTEGQPFERVFLTRAYTDPDRAITCHPFGHAYISERLSGRLNLRDENPYFISAQTGSGKTQFVLNDIYPLVRSRGKRLLVLVSRSALKDKVKLDAIRAAGTEQEKLLTREGIAREHHFGDIDVFSYQDFAVDASCSAHRKDFEASLGSYGAVIFDEVHFFTSDADFNVSTRFSAKYLIENTCRAHIPRIYMSATPDVVFDSIVDLDKEMFEEALNYYIAIHGHPWHMDLFHFSRDYGYILPRSFERDDLPALICEGGASKWIVFINSRRFGEDLKDKILKTCPDKNVIFLNSDLLHHFRNTSEVNTVVNSICDEEDLGCDVLLTTTCLDVGVNIKTSNVNIVNCLTDRVEFVQAIGRKRVSTEETVNLFIPKYKPEDVDRWIQRVKRRLAEIDKIAQFCPEGKVVTTSAIQPPVYVVGGQYQQNQFAWVKLDHQLQELEALKEHLHGNEKEQSYDIFRWMLSWLSLEPPSLSEEEDPLRRLIEHQLTKPSMDQHEFDLFASELIKLSGDPRSDKRSSRSKISTRTVNTVLDPYGFTCKKRTSKDRHTEYTIKLSMKEE